MRKVLTLLVIGGACWASLGFVAVLSAQEARPGGELREPVHRVARTDDRRLPDAGPAHPLDPALKVAYEGLEHIRRDVQDFTCTIVKRERIDGELGEQQFLSAKIRHRQVEGNQVVVPFSVYLKFLKPASIAGREVIWVEGRNEGKLIAHEVPGFRNVIRANLLPTGWMAMRGNRYPIYEIGMARLVEQLIEKGERDRQKGECEVQFFQGAKINGRVCTMIQVMHPTPREHFDFHIAQIFVDDEMQVPVRYAAYTWPAAPGGKPELLEEYTYLNIELNVGLTEMDFNPDNPEYQYP